eukprot:5843818-Prymnesium_polylepis.2
MQLIRWGRNDYAGRDEAPGTPNPNSFQAWHNEEGMQTPGSTRVEEMGKRPVQREEDLLLNKPSYVTPDSRAPDSLASALDSRKSNHARGASEGEAVVTAGKFGVSVYVPDVAPRLRTLPLGEHSLNRGGRRVLRPAGPKAGRVCLLDDRQGDDR